MDEGHGRIPRHLRASEVRKLSKYVRSHSKECFFQPLDEHSGKCHPFHTRVVSKMIRTIDLVD